MQLVKFEIEDMSEEEMEIYRTNQASEDEIDDLLSELEEEVESEEENQPNDDTNYLLEELSMMIHSAQCLQ